MIAHLHGVLTATYRLQARRFALDYPGETPPDDIADLDPSYLDEILSMTGTQTDG